jgi:hypothetical protein
MPRALVKSGAYSEILNESVLGFPTRATRNHTRRISLQRLGLEPYRADLPYAPYPFHTKA